jgi:transposase-like protein
MMVYSSKNILVTELFIRDVLNYYDGKLMFVVDRVPWLTKVLEELGL